MFYVKFRMSSTWNWCPQSRVIFSLPQVFVTHNIATSLTSLAFKKSFHAWTISIALPKCCCVTYTLDNNNPKVTGKKRISTSVMLSNIAVSLWCDVTFQPQEYTWVSLYQVWDKPISSHFPLWYEWHLNNVCFSVWLTTTSLALIAVGIVLVLSVSWGTPSSLCFGVSGFLQGGVFRVVNFRNRACPAFPTLRKLFNILWCVHENYICACKLNSEWGRLCVYKQQGQQTTLWGFEI